MRSRYGSCSSCGARIIWMRTPAGKGMPAEPDTVPPGDMMFDAKAGHVSHFATCPDRLKHRRAAEPEAELPARQLALLPDLAPAAEPDEFGDLDAPAPAPPPEWPFMTDERIAEFRRTLRTLGLGLAVFRAIRKFEGITAPPETWTEAEYYSAVALAVRTAMLRDAMVRGGMEAWQKAKAQTGLEYEHEDFRRLLAGEQKESA